MQRAWLNMIGDKMKDPRKGETVAVIVTFIIIELALIGVLAVFNYFEIRG